MLVNKKRANAARLPLWMYVLAWLVRTTRLAEHDLNAAPNHGTGATATGDNSPVKERTPLELYAKIIEAYYNVDNSFENRSLRLIQKEAIAVIIFMPYLALGYSYGWIPELVVITLFVVLLVIAASLYFLYMKKLRDCLRDCGITIKYRGLIRLTNVTPTGAARELYRYFLFQNKLKEYKISVKDVKCVIALFDIEHKTLSSYVAQRPFAVCLWTTTGAVLATSATNWPFERIIGWVALAFLLFIAHYVFSVFFRDQKRQYEVHRFLTWYQADASEPTASTPDRPNLLPG